MGGVEEGNMILMGMSTRSQPQTVGWGGCYFSPDEKCGVRAFGSD